MAGLPGTGLGGIFYILLVFWIAVRESCSALKRRGQGRWISIAELSFYAIAILAVCWAEAWLLKIVAEQFSHLPIFQATHPILHAIAPVLTLVPFAVLGTLMLILHIVRWVYPVEFQLPSPGYTMSQSDETPSRRT
mgnify:CR=1 FL=1